MFHWQLNFLLSKDCVGGPCGNIEIYIVSVDLKKCKI